MDRVERAVDVAYAWALRLPDPPPKSTRRRTRVFAVGDPQAPLETFLRVLDHKGLLGDDGALAPDVKLISLGDHFDWGKPEDAARATDDALALLAWLAHHPWDQVVLIAGNHDLARVGELASFDDETFARVRAEALIAYRGGDVDEDAQRALLSRWPMLPSAEVAARDFSAFRVHQRALVEHLLRRERFVLAWAPDDVHLFSHAGVTKRVLRELGLEGQGARAIADGLNRALEESVARRREGEPLEIPRVHRPGDAARGEGGGVLFHRACTTKPENDRRFHPRGLPKHLTQIIGHVRDKKSRELLGLDTSGARDGVVRHLIVNEEQLEYGFGVREGAHMIFADGGMNHVDPRGYELLALDPLRAFQIP